MKKIFLYTILLLLIPSLCFGAWSGTINGKTPTKLSGKTITFANGLNVLSFTSGDPKMAYVATGAMIFDANASPQDLSPYAGSGTASHYVSEYAGTTFVGAGFAGAKGGGEATGDELLTGWVNRGSPNNYATFTSTGKDIDSAINSAGNNSIADIAAFASTPGALYKDVCTLTLNSGTAPVVDIFYYPEQIGTHPNFVLSNGLNVKYSTNHTGGNRYGYINVYALSNFSAVCSIKRLTDCTDKGLKLYSTKTLATQSLASQPGVASVNSMTKLVVHQVK